MNCRFLITVLFLLFPLSSCFGQSSAIPLSKKQFLEKVVDYESNPDQMKYLGDKPAVVDFCATWCEPCERLAPIMEELAREYSGKIYFYKVDVDIENELADDIGVDEIPALIFFPMNASPQVVLGDLPKENLIKIIEEVF